MPYHVLRSDPAKLRLRRQRRHHRERVSLGIRTLCAVPIAIVFGGAAAYVLGTVIIPGSHVGNAMVLAVGLFLGFPILWIERHWNPHWLPLALSTTATVGALVGGHVIHYTMDAHEIARTHLEERVATGVLPAAVLDAADLRPAFAQDVLGESQAAGPWDHLRARAELGMIVTWYSEGGYHDEYFYQGGVVWLCWFLQAVIMLGTASALGWVFCSQHEAEMQRQGSPAPQFPDFGSRESR